MSTVSLNCGVHVLKKGFLEKTSTWKPRNLTMRDSYMIEILDEDAKDKVTINLLVGWIHVVTRKNMTESQKKKFPPGTNIEAVLGLPSQSIFSSTVWILFSNPQDYNSVIEKLMSIRQYFARRRGLRFAPGVRPNGFLLNSTRPAIGLFSMTQHFNPIIPTGLANDQHHHHHHHHNHGPDGNIDSHHHHHHHHEPGCSTDSHHHHHHEGATAAYNEFNSSGDINSGYLDFNAGFGMENGAITDFSGVATDFSGAGIDFGGIGADFGGSSGFDFGGGISNDFGSSSFDFSSGSSDIGGSTMN